MPEDKQTLSEAMSHAVATHRAGNLADAERLYKAIVARKPDHIDALHLLGVIECQRGSHEAGIVLMDKALSISPNHALVLSNRARALSALKRPKEALDSYIRSLAIDPDDFDALYHCGVVLCELNRPVEALASFAKAIALKPDHAEALRQHGATLAALNRFGEALESYDRALRIRPDDFDMLFARGMVLRNLKRPEEALASFEKALMLKRDSFAALCNRADLLSALNRLKEAVDSYDEALAVRPDADAYFARGVLLNKLTRPEQALASFERALELRPDHIEALNNRGIAFLVLNRRHDALDCFDRALAIRPHHAAALNNKAVALQELNRLEESIESRRRALTVKPNPAYHSNLIFALNFDPDATAALHQAERARWNDIHAARFGSSIRPHRNNRDPNRRLRVGYVSSYFRYHAAVYAFGGVILCHDSNQFELTCYSDTVNEDGVTRRLRACADKWHSTAGSSDDQLAELIRKDEIDILVDCVGHMSGNRLPVFARKPAPVQVTAWGEPTGTGLKTMDYLFADPVLVPLIERPLMAERIFDLPNFLGYWTPDALPEPARLPALHNGYVTFGSFNRLVKMQDPVLRSWAAILRAVPGAHFTLKCAEPSVDPSERDRLLRVFGEVGIAAERVKLIGRTDRMGHFASFQEVDIALDPFPHGGGMSTLDALWMGVPVVTWAGRTISSRLAAASLTALNLTDFVASDVGSYETLAVAKASDISALARLRATLRDRIAASAVGDPKRYANAVEAAYRAMWRNWCANK